MVKVKKLLTVIVSKNSLLNKKLVYSILWKLFEILVEYLKVVFGLARILIIGKQIDLN